MPDWRKYRNQACDFLAGLPAAVHELSIAGRIAVAGLFVFAIWVIAAEIHRWRAIPDTEISGSGWTAIVLMAVVTGAVGVGLTALLYYSNRNNYDR